MRNEISINLNAKEKAEFLYLNSGLILSKLNDDFNRNDTENHLQILLFYDTKLDDLVETKFSLLSKCCNVSYDNNYESAMNIIFHMANLINNSEFHEDGKARLRNQLRKYTKFFPYDKDDLIKNKKYVRFYEKN